MSIQNTKIKSFALALALAIGTAPFAPALAKNDGGEGFRFQGKMNGFLNGQAKFKTDLGFGVRGADFCEYINNQGDAWVNNVALKFVNKEANRMHRGNDTAQKRADRDARLERARTEADERRADFYAHLEAKADTAQEEAAVNQYIVKMNAAIQTKRASVDAAVSAYRTGVDAAIAAEGTDFNTALNEFKSEAQAAINKAKTDCNNGVASTQVRAAFSTAIALSVEDFKIDANVSSEFKAKLKALAETQKQALRSAREAYQAASMQAHAELRAAFNL